MIRTNLLQSPLFIKINAGIIGYGLWIIFSQYQIITHTFQIPVCFYKLDNNNHVIAPDHVHITLSLKRNILTRFDTYNSAIHIDASKLDIGNNHVMLIKDNIFLPDETHVVNIIPSYIEIQLQKNE